MRKTPQSQYPQIQRWKRANMKIVGAQYRKEFVEEFRKACAKLGISQSDVIRKAMNDTIEKAEGK